MSGLLSLILFVSINTQIAMNKIKTKPDWTFEFWEIESESTPSVNERRFPVWPKEWPIKKGVSIFTDKEKTGTVIGELSEITFDQAFQIVANISGAPIPDQHPRSMVLRCRIKYKNYINNEYEYISALESLKSAAQSVGIEEKDFDKYLVIKL